jgi:hypothetical protein
MSAWIVSKKHIDLMVAAITRGTRDGVVKPRRKNADRLGQMLVDECVRSVSYRYPRDDARKGELPGPSDRYYLRPYTFEDPMYLPTAAETAKAVDCYRYQSCEHPGWEESAACRLTGRIGEQIVAKVPAARRMREAGRHWETVWPEYEAAPWGFGWESIALAFAVADPDTGRLLLRAIGANPAETTCHKALIDWLAERGMIPESRLPLDALPVTDYEMRRVVRMLAA